MSLCLECEEEMYQFLRVSDTEQLVQILMEFIPVQDVATTMICPFLVFEPKAGTLLIVRDTLGFWYKSTVLQTKWIEHNSVLVMLIHYNGWPPRCVEWIEWPCCRRVSLYSQCKCDCFMERHVCRKQCKNCSL